MNKNKVHSSTIIKCAFLTLILALGNACATKAPYAHGPVMNEKSIKETFGPILGFMNYQPGMSFADVGAGSGAITVMMGTLMNNSAIFIQDIDKKILQQDNLDKIIAHYSEKSKLNMQTNQFSIVHGEANHSLLPDQSLDLIYTNATLHVFDSPDSMFIDLRKKLKPTGTIFIRDDFKNQNGKGESCGDPTCAKPLHTEDELLTIMKRNGFELLKHTSNMSGSPLYGFALKE